MKDEQTDTTDQFLDHKKELAEISTTVRLIDGFWHWIVSSRTKQISSGVSNTYRHASKQAENILIKEKIISNRRG